MPSLSTILAYAGFAGAIASWIVGGVFYVSALRAAGDASTLKRFAVPFWPFATGLLPERTVLVGKAQVAFIACMLVGVAAFSASANLHRFAK